MLAAFVGYSGGAIHTPTHPDARVRLQSEIDDFVVSYRRSPDSLEELAAKLPNVRDVIADLNGEPTLYEKQGRWGYVLTFAGPDGKLGMADDLTITDDFTYEGAGEKAKKNTLGRRLKRTIDALGRLQNQVDAFVSGEGHSPTTVEELIGKRPDAQRALEDLADDRIQYEKIGERGYHITLDKEDPKFVITISDAQNFSRYLADWGKSHARDRGGK